MDSKSLVFLGLVSGPRQYRIPSFQRAYSWEREDRETLWLDLLTQYEVLDSIWHLPEGQREDELSKRATHYLGTIVLSGPSSLGVPKSDVIDGQQRITTLLLAVCALRDHWGSQIAKESGVDAAIEKRRSLSNTYLVNDGQQGNERFRVLPLSADEKAFKAIVNFSGSGGLNADGLGLEPGDSDRMLTAYKFFRTEIARRSVPEANVQLKRFAHLFPLDPEKIEQTIAHRLSVIAIETKNNDDTNAIFESLNAKGRPLNQLDLLRNYVFMSLGSQADTVLQEEWRPIEQTHLPDRRDMEAFVWADVVARGTNVLQKRTYRTVQSELREAGGGAAPAVDYVKRLRRRAPFYARILDPSKCSHPGLRESLDRLARCGGRTARPFVLWLFEELHHERCSLEDVSACVRHIESFIVRRFLCAMPPNNLNSMFGIMLSRLNNASGGLGPGSGSVEDRVLSVLLSVAKDWPDNDALDLGVRTHDFYHNGDTRQRMHILRSVDLSFGYDLVPGYEESDKSIEHVLPQASSQSEAAAPWVSDLLELGQDYASVRDKFLHTLGNLTLVAPSDNASLGTKRFQDKAQIYAGLGYKMTRALANAGTVRSDERLWGANDIEERSQDLAELAIQIWSRPDKPAISSDSLGDTAGSEVIPSEVVADIGSPVPFSSSISEEADTEA